MYKFYNAHPKGKRVQDCVKRAITVAEGRDYKEVQKDLNRIKRELGAKDFKRTKVWKTYVQRKGYEKLSFPAEKGKPRMNGRRFCEAYPQGTYILRQAKHLSVCIDGVIYDIFNPEEKCVYNAYRVR